MIKKFALINVCLLTVGFLFGCTDSKSNGETFRLSDEYYTSENKGLLYSSYQNSIAVKTEDKATFVSLVYLPGCPSCALFTPIVEKYASSNNLQFYAVDVIDIRENDSELFKTIKYAPAFIIFKEGEFFTYLDSGNKDQSKYFKSGSSFKSWFESYIDITPPTNKLLTR